tara:strand:- start:948 stop:1346 length:399 start_codon:yes stop_codon:yes gene_type:complete
MQGRDLKNKLLDIIKEEVNSVLKEEGKKLSSIANPKKMDPNDPEIYIKGFGTYSRTALRMQIARRLKGISDTARKAAKGGPMASTLYKNLDSLVGEGSIISTLIKSELETSIELETMRTKGGRRSMPIPKQF